MIKLGKYKAKSVKTDEWITANELWRIDGALILLTEKFKKSWMGVESVKVHEETLCRYSGKTDKNDDKIYENDLLYARSRGYHAIMRRNGEHFFLEVYYIDGHDADEPIPKVEINEKEMELTSNLHDMPLEFCGHMSGIRKLRKYFEEGT